ncbi:MAG: NAD(P)-dependent oxidoreductase [Candidatus Heimdallarchaeota archaeon]|nr:NAD(P)-dependent oxidoreductase [Candidatus Heimdallarchaeota archaeon]MBY8993944.1 NAD(P)-dependent oxidoreductase [Candidatus Heimdallarchaeota archaeon]
MAILITGGSGFVGGNLVKELVENKKEWGIDKKDIFVLVRENSNIDELNKLDIGLVIGDLTDHESLSKAVKGKSLIFHLGAVVLDQVAQEMLQKVNVDGTKALIDAFVKEKTAKKFVFVSTWGVYGYKVKPKPLKEDQPFHPTNEYQKSKLDSEQIVWEYHKKHKLPVAVARLPMILGPSDTLTTPRVVQAFFDEEVKMVGKGKNLYSGVDVRDAARAIISMGIKEEGNGNVYNVKSFDISQKDYWLVHKEAMKSDFKIPNYPRWIVMIYALMKEISAKRKGIGKPTMTRYRVMRYGNTRILDISKIRKDLGWEPKYTDGKAVIRESVNWLIQHNFIDYENKKVTIVRKWEDQLKRKKN